VSKKKRTGDDRSAVKNDVCPNEDDEWECDFEEVLRQMPQAGQKADRDAASEDDDWEHVAVLNGHNVVFGRRSYAAVLTTS
jgi:hypothetical protein